MSRFMKLTQFVFNTNDIHKIVIQPNKYTLHIVSKNLDGFYWSICGTGSGSFNSHVSEIEVCKFKHATDYKKVSDWMREFD